MDTAMLHRVRMKKFLLVFAAICMSGMFHVKVFGVGNSFFPQSVASGDPTSSSVVLWTRCVVDGDEVSDHPVELTMVSGSQQEIEVGATTELRGNNVYQGEPLLATRVHDGCVKVRVESLRPDTYYYYQFRYETGNGPVFSAVGRTRTAPTPESDQKVSFAVLNCADYSGRYYNTLKHLVDQESDSLNFVVHLGDYIYETTADPSIQAQFDNRLTEFSNASEAISFGVVQAARSLSNYRDLYKIYRTDAHLMRAHELFPWVLIWDDHEFSGDHHGATATYFDGKVHELDEDRKRHAEQAWLEYVPCNLGLDDAGKQLEINEGILFPNTRIYRTLSFGSNLDLIMTDNRTFRQDHIIPEDAFPGGIVMEETFTKLAVDTVFGAGTFDVFRDQLDPYVLFGQSVSYFGEPKENFHIPNPAFQGTAFENFTFAEALQDLIRARTAQELSILPAGMEPATSPEEYALNAVNQPMSATWINFLFTSAGFPAPISQGTIDTLRRGVSYFLIGKAAHFTEVGSRYQVVDPSFQLLAGFQYQAFRSTGGLLGKDESFYGETQESFLKDALSTSVQRGAKWRLVCSSSPFTPIMLNLADLPDDVEFPRMGRIVGDQIGERIVSQEIPNEFKIPFLMNADEVAGFPSYRQKIIDLLAGHDAVLLSGDIHASMLGRNKASTGESVIDFTVPSTASGELGRALNGALEFMENLIAGEYRRAMKDPSIDFEFERREEFLSIIQRLIVHSSDQLDYLNANTQGYLYVDVDAQAVTGEFREIKTSNVFTDLSQQSDEGTDSLFARRSFVVQKEDSDVKVKPGKFTQALTLQSSQLKHSDRFVFPLFQTEKGKEYQLAITRDLSNPSWLPLKADDILAVNGAAIDDLGLIIGTGEGVSVLLRIPDTFKNERELFIRAVTARD